LILDVKAIKSNIPRPKGSTAPKDEARCPLLAQSRHRVLRCYRGIGSTWCTNVCVR